MYFLYSFQIVKESLRFSFSLLSSAFLTWYQRHERNSKFFFSDRIFSINLCSGSSLSHLIFDLSFFFFWHQLNNDFSLRMSSSSVTVNSAINVLDPLYIHPSDAPDVNLINEKLTGNTNYDVWTQQWWLPCEPKTNWKLLTIVYATLLHWERCNVIVLSWIMNFVSKEIFTGIVYSIDATVVWKY